MPEPSDKNGKTFVDREASKLPYTRCPKDGRVIAVKLGAIGWVFVLACLGVIATTATLTEKVLAGEAADKKIKSDIETIHGNVGKIDESQRATDQSVRYAVELLQALVDANPEIRGPTELPPLTASELEDLTDE